jgi:hypothetical protein
MTNRCQRSQLVSYRPLERRRTLDQNPSYLCRNARRNFTSISGNPRGGDLDPSGWRVFYSMRTVANPLECTPDPTRISRNLPASEELESIIRRFEEPARRGVRRLVYSSPRLADLAQVFPACLHAMAMRRGKATQRRKALQLIESGAQLREVARALELPLWLRRLPPEAFVHPVPKLPSSEFFQRRIINQLPQSASESALWLSSVAFAAEACNEYFAVWLASQNVFSDPGDPWRLFSLLAAYAWFSSNEATKAHSLIVVPWRPEMAFDTAACAAKSWLNRMRLIMQLKKGAITDTWLSEGEARGFSFVPLIEQSEILAEAHAMQNCADQYSDRIARDKCRLFSVRRKGTRIATLEIGSHHRESGFLSICQLKGRHNMPASLEVWLAAHAWMAEQKELRRTPPLVTPERPLDQATWETLMLPYRLKKRGAPWIPEVMSLSVISYLDKSMAEVARRGGVSSWLFT